MLDQMTFATRKEAQVELAKMSGWDAKVSQLYMPDDPKANARGNVFVIQVKRGTGDPMYIRDDGYVR